jgi:hypothetical protein
MLSHVPAPSFDATTTGRKPAAEQPVTSHTYAIRSLPQSHDNLVSASSNSAMGSGNTDHLKQLEETLRKESQEGFKTTITSGISELTSVVKGFQTGLDEITEKGGEN